MSEAAMIEVRELRKSYGDFEAVRGISFEVARGQVVGFLGPNGAGKSTTLRILAGFLGATSGDVLVEGFSVTESPLEARARIGYMPESTPLYPEMRIGEYLRFRAELKGVARSSRGEAVARAIDDAGLGGMEGVLVGQLSKGYRQRVGLADALVASPPLLVLDEPTAGLDPNQIREVRALIRRLSERHTILVSTHILSEVEAMCSRGVVIARGKLVAQGTIDELRAMSLPTSARLRIRGLEDAARRALDGLDGIAQDGEGLAFAAQSDGTLRVTARFVDRTRGEATTERVVGALVAAGLGVLEVTPQSSLEQVFAELTARVDPAEPRKETARPAGARKKSSAKKGARA
jgi:ABC-2 type transport system ATP-binding protein